MILQATIFAVLSVASPMPQATNPPAQITVWEAYLLEQVTAGQISPQEYSELRSKFTEPAAPGAPSKGDPTTWLLGAAATLLVLEVRLRKFLSTLLRGVLENLRPFFKDVLREVLEEKEKPE